MSDEVTINNASGNVNCDHINVRESMVVSCAVDHRNGRMGAVMVPYAPMDDITLTQDGAAESISTKTHATLIITDTYDSTHVLGSGKAKNQVKVIRVSGSSGSAEIIPNNFKNGTSITLSVSADVQQAMVKLLWRENTWTVIDRSPDAAVINIVV